MIYNIFPQKDTTIYSRYPTANAGLDEILELQKEIVDEDNANYISRILIQFNSDEIKLYPTASSNYTLKMYESENTDIPLSYNILCYPNSRSWQMGVGKVTYTPTVKTGCSWNYVDGNNDKTVWNPQLSGSNQYGGAWLTNYIVSQSYESFTYDIDMNITDIVNLWNNDTIENYGLIIKRDSNSELNNESLGNLNYFSNNSNTIFKPRLQIKWDDFSFETGSLSEMTSSITSVFYPKNLMASYYYKSKIRINMFGREKYIRKTFNTSFQTVDNKYFATASYSIIDDSSNEVIIPFDDTYTRISCDETGNYFDLWLEQLEPQRTYRLAFKVQDTEGHEYYYNGKYIFEVTSNW